MSLQTKLTGATSAYDLARTLLAQHGISTPDQAYAACPDMHPRTVRRIFAEGQIIDGLPSPTPDTVLKEKGELITNVTAQHEKSNLGRTPRKTPTRPSQTDSPCF